MKKFLLLVLLIAPVISSDNSRDRNIRSRPNIFGGRDYYSRSQRIRSIPNIHQGNNYSNGWRSHRNIFNGENFHR